MNDWYYIDYVSLYLFFFDPPRPQVSNLLEAIWEDYFKLNERHPVRLWNFHTVVLRVMYMQRGLSVQNLVLLLCNA